MVVVQDVVLEDSVGLGHEAGAPAGGAAGVLAGR